MHELFDESEAVRVTLLCDAQGESWYCTVSRNDFDKTARENVVYGLRLLSREYLFFKVIAGFVVSKDTGGFSLRRDFRHAGIDVSSSQFEQLIDVGKKLAVFHPKV